MHARILTHGSISPLPDAAELRAGRLSVMYEAGFIRYVRNGQNEIVRMINHYIRDSNWNTMPMKILTEQVEASAHAFLVEYTAVVKHNDVDFNWKCTITGNADETIVFTIEGEAQSAFFRNRLGFTVLHPTEPLRGQACRITHADNTTEELFFPDLVSPHQPFLDIQAMAWSPAAGVQAALTFSGDIFEMEDQRNWLDASHKTYCTPLSLGFPKAVAAGDRVSQSIHLKVFGDLLPADGAEEVATFSIEPLKGMRMPAVGIPVSDLAMTTRQHELIAGLGPDFMSVAIRGNENVSERISQTLSYGLPLEVVLFPGSAAADGLVSALKPFAAHIRQVVVLPEGKRAADAALVDAFVPLLRKHLPKARIGSGTDAFFTELNRSRTPAEKLDFLTFSVNPQTHASDIRTMTENLIAHRDVVESCRTFAGGRDVRVGPITLKMRWNPDAKTDDAPAADVLPPNVDARQLSLFAAGWTLGSLKYLTESEAAAAVYYEVAGWRGLMAHAQEPWPETFGVDDAQVYPVFVMLRLLLTHRNAAVLRLVSSDRLRLDGMAFRDERETTVVLANYSGDPLSVAVPGGFEISDLVVAGSDNIQLLLERPLEDPASRPFRGDTFLIPPFGFARLKTIEN